MKIHMTKFQEIQLQLENTKERLIEKDKALNKSNNEINRITAQLEQTTAQVRFCLKSHVGLSSKGCFTHFGPQWCVLYRKYCM